MDSVVRRLELLKLEGLGFSKALKKMKGKFLLTYNNDKIIQLFYRKYPQIVVKTAKTMDRTHTNPTQEHRIVANFDIVNRKFPRFEPNYSKL